MGIKNLFGEYRHKIDAKNRLSLPSDFRKEVPEVLMVTQSPESNCLMIYDIDGFGAWVESLFARDGGYSASNAKHVARRRVLNSRARKVELDKTGRIGLSAELRNAVGIDKDVVVVGNDTSIEIWDEARWDEYCANVDILDVYDDES